MSDTAAAAHPPTSTDPDADRETITMLADSARDFCARSLPVTRLRTLRGSAPPFDSTQWRAMCELGWGSILLPEACGGLGLGASAVGAVCRELGRVIAPEPMLECGVGAAALLAAVPSAEALAGRLASGEILLAAALTAADERAGGGGELMLRRQGDRSRLDGRACQVPLGDTADGWLVVAEEDGEPALLHLAAGSTGLGLELHTVADGSRAATLVCDGVAIADDRVLARGPAVHGALVQAREMTSLAASAYLVGLAEQLFDITLDYLKTRRQFGRPIGSFQAIQHYLAQTITEIVGAEATAIHAAWSLDQGLPSRASVAKAKVLAGDTFKQASAIGSQIYGGIGFDEDMDTTLYLRRGKQLQLSMGHSGYWEEIIAEQLLDA